MKVVAIVWRDPNHNLKVEKFDTADMSVRTDPGWLKLIGKEGVVRLIPSDKVALVEYMEEDEPAKIISPHAVPSPSPFPS